VRANPESWEGYGPLPPKPALEKTAPASEAGVGDGKPASSKERSEPLKGHWNLRLSSFQKLIFIKTFQEEQVR